MCHSWSNCGEHTISAGHLGAFTPYAFLASSWWASTGRMSLVLPEHQGFHWRIQGPCTSSVVRRLSGLYPLVGSVGVEAIHNAGCVPYVEPFYVAVGHLSLA